MKQCEQCGEHKPDDGYYCHKTKSGEPLFSKCKECVRANVRKNRRENIAHYRAYDRKRGNRQGLDYVRSYRESNPNKYLAHNKVNNAVRDGRLFKLDVCEDCGSNESVHAHHDDYSKPLEVRWLCAACHSAWHKEHGEAANAA